MKQTLTAFLLLSFFALCAQKREEFFNYSFKPAATGNYYYVVTEKKDSLWYREAYYLAQKSLALQGWYKDSDCTVPHGTVSRYHRSGLLQSKGNYVNGEKEGLWLGYDSKGNLADSSTYHQNHRTGLSFRWHANGMLKDSFDFDSHGNGVQVSWYDDGQLASAGSWVGDTAKAGRWKYYHKNGSTLATEDYANGKLVVCNCYTETGQALDPAACREREAVPAGGLAGWRNFLQRGLQRMLETKARSREWAPGERTVVVRFVVEKDGSLSEFAPVTQNGQQMEEEVIRLLQQAPRWTPGRQWGRPARSYHTQPLTFVIETR